MTTAFLAAVALTFRAVSAGSEHFDLLKGASGIELASLWSDVCDRVLPCMSATSAAKFGMQLTDAMVADVLPGFVHSVSVELADFRQVQLLDVLALEGSRHVKCVADVATGAGLDALPVASNCVLGDGDVASPLWYILGVCPVAMQDKPLVCDRGKPFSPGQAMRCACCAGARAMIFPLTRVGACVHKPGQASAREPADTDLQGVSFLDPVLVNGKRVDFHMFILSGSDR